MHTHRRATPFRLRSAALLPLACLLVASLALPGCGGRRGRTRATPVTPATQKAEARRDVWQKPALVTKKMGLLPGMTIADIGSGAGYMLPHLSRAVGPKGRVFAVEIDDKVIAALKRRVARTKLHNVTVVKGAADDLPITALVDRILLLNTYPELEKPVAMLRSMREHLKPTGRLVVIDYKADVLIPGPPADERLSLETITAEARGAGFVESLQFDVLPRQYFALFINFEETEAGDEDVDAPVAPTPTDAPVGNDASAPTDAND